MGDVAMVRKFCLLLLCVSTLVHAEVTAPAAPGAILPPGRTPGSVQAYYERALSIIETEALHRDRVDWPQLRETLDAQVRSARTVPDTYGAITAALRALDDRHSLFLPLWTERTSSFPSALRA